ncbi:hypothetical protein ATEIFO6365_0005057100 [Aspergillus terreus]|uniref:Uncharacterized protein n=1 Tax=Aspergillus terreus TaxID=33178 RepID=A0A8H3MQS0_ASPTE|nr:hypothetical protein ATEIFO6365_0005057100 [Aspergillus terreus]
MTLSIGTRAKNTQNHGFQPRELHLDPRHCPDGDIGRFEPFHLNQYGNEMAEIKELKHHLSWARAMEVGKFYSHRDADKDWYYYVYGQTTAADDKNLPHNDIASRCIGRTIHGDVAVIRSGPEQSNDYSETFSREELLRTSDFYRRNDPHEQFKKQERARISAMVGGIPGFANIPHIVI